MYTNYHQWYFYMWHTGCFPYAKVHHIRVRAPLLISTCSMAGVLGVHWFSERLRPSGCTVSQGFGRISDQQNFSLVPSNLPDLILLVFSYVFLFDSSKYILEISHTNFESWRKDSKWVGYLVHLKIRALEGLRIDPSMQGIHMQL